MNKLGNFFKSKIVIFAIQIALLSLFIFLFNFKSEITFVNEISLERRTIIQFLANYVIFTVEKNGLSGFFFIFLSWTVVALIPIFIYNDFKKAWSMNLTTFFFPNFFFYVFFARYSQPSYDIIFPTIFGQTLILSLFLVGFSICLSLLLRKLKPPMEEVKIEDLKSIEAMTKSVCPYCGTEFNSIPKYCYNCSKELIINKTEKK
jgi:hypothetical protein